jgi:hypothetical protein
MAQPSSYLSDQLVRQMNVLEKTRSRMEFLLSSGDVRRSDIEQVYSGLYMKAITSFEYLVEALFLGLLVGRFTPSTSKIVCRVDFRSDVVAREVVFGGRNYVDWFPYKNTEQRAKAFFRSGRPFTGLSKADKTILETLLCIRNAIAHPSRHARRRFEDEVIGSLPLTPQEMSPAGFLRSPFRIAPRQTRFENAVSDMVQVARTLCK